MNSKFNNLNDSKLDNTQFMVINKIKNDTIASINIIKDKMEVIEQIEKKFENFMTNLGELNNSVAEKDKEYSFKFNKLKKEISNKLELYNLQQLRDEILDYVKTSNQDIRDSLKIKMDKLICEKKFEMIYKQLNT